MHRRRRYGERLGLAERLVAERKRRGLRQIDAAREIRISRETLALVEVHHIPSRATQAKINGWMAAPPVKAAITVSETGVAERGSIPVVVIATRYQAVEPRARGQPPQGGRSS